MLILKEYKIRVFQDTKEDCGYKTVALKWCTPKATTSSVETWPRNLKIMDFISTTFTTIYRRPSSMASFLLGGRYKRLYFNSSSKTYLYFRISLGPSCWNCRDVVQVEELHHTCWPLTDETCFYIPF